MTNFGFGGVGGAASHSAPGPEGDTTGGFLVLLDEDTVDEGVAAVEQAAGLSLARTADFEGGAFDAEQVRDANGIVFDQLGVAVVEAAPDQTQAISTLGAEQPGVIVEPERYVYALSDIGPRVGGAPVAPPQAQLTGDFLRGYSQAIQGLLAAVSGTGTALETAAVAPTVTWDEAEATWGLQAVDAVTSAYSGKGIRVAVLDTGLDLNHPDLTGRAVSSQSFVDGEAAQDGHGHGTHCIGTACGSRGPAVLPRYGVAHSAEIFAGKVLSNRGSGADRGILAGINWAITNGCRLVSMSLGAPTQIGQPFSRVFERVGRRAMRRGTLIIAAAGNESRRNTGLIAPVGHPANCPSIMAIGALDPQFQVAPFSCGGLNPKGGQVDLAAPGVDVHSSWPMPVRYRRLNGTSMATPHVAGIAALLAEANPDASAGELWCLLTQTARRLPLPATDVGAGLAQAP